MHISYIQIGHCIYQIPQKILSWLYTYQSSGRIPTSKLCGFVWMDLLSRIKTQSPTMTSNQTLSTFWKLVNKMEYWMTCLVRLTGIVRQLINLSQRRKNNENSNILYTCTNVMCPFQLKSRRPCHTVSWNLTNSNAKVFQPNCTDQTESGYP